MLSGSSSLSVIVTRSAAVALACLPVASAAHELPGSMRGVPHSQVHLCRNCFHFFSLRLSCLCLCACVRGRQNVSCNSVYSGTAPYVSVPIQGMMEC